jgi:hypothetical protein
MFLQRHAKRSDWRKSYEMGVSRKSLYIIGGVLHVIPGRGCPEGQSGAGEGPDRGGEVIMQRGWKEQGHLSGCY